MPRPTPMIRHLLAATMLTAIAIAPLRGADWPQYLGPGADATSTESGLMREWPQGGPPVVWTADLGIGFGGATVRDGEVFVLDRQTGERDILRCFALADGAERWSFAYDAPGKINHPGSRSLPSVDAERVYITGPFGHFHCVSRETHQPLWQTHLLERFEGSKPNWAVAQSPRLYKDWVIVAPVGKKAGVVAFDRATGQIAWQSPPLPGRMSYATPIIVDIEDTPTVLVVTTAGVVGVEVGTGKILWHFDEWKCGIPIPVPTVLPGGDLLIVAGYNAGGARFRVSRGAGGWTAEKVWHSRDIHCQMHQPLVHEGHIYMNNNDNSNKSGMACFDMDGNMLWNTGESPWFERGAVAMAAGRIWAVDASTGELALVRPDSGRYVELGRMALLHKKQPWAPIAISDGRMLVRDQHTLKCLDIRAR